MANRTRFTAAFYSLVAERLGYDFQDRALLRRALTHSSSQAKRGDYERLEFLGDRVLALVLAEHLYRNEPRAKEGDMAAHHSALVKGSACAEVGRAMGLPDLIILGDKEHSKGVNLNATIIGDVMEALIAGIYLDSGLETARQFILKNWTPLLDKPRNGTKDAKTFLQEWALARALPIPAYRVVGREGPEHSPVFEVMVDVKGKEPATGRGLSKRAAEQGAADALLRRERIER